MCVSNLNTLGKEEGGGGRGVNRAKATNHSAAEGHPIS